MQEAGKAIRQALEEDEILDKLGARLTTPPAEATEAFLRTHGLDGGIARLDASARAELAARLEPEALAATMQQHRQRIASAGPAAGRLTRELLRDPLHLRNLMPSANGNTTINVFWDRNWFT